MFKKISLSLLRQYSVIVTVNLLALCIGMDIGWPSPMLVKLRNLEQSPLSSPITIDEGGWIVSIGYVFSIFMLPCLGLLLDYIGRRYSILLYSIPKIVAGLITIFATKVWMLLVSRVINGVTTTGAMVIIMVYSTEISSKEVRGSLGLFISIFCNLGILVMLTVGPYISYLNLNIMMTAITACATMPLLFIPDTPYSLYNRGQIEEAKKVLIYFRDSKELAEEELKELSQIKLNQKLDKREILKNKVYIKSLIIVILMGIGIQFTGFNFISFYLQTILELSDTSVSPAMGSVVIGVIQMLTTIIAGIFVDRFGRRPLLFTTLSAMAVGMIGLGISFMMKQHNFISGFLNYLPLISIAVVTCSYSGGLGSLYFVLVTELLDGPIRAIGSALSSVASNLALFLLTRYAMTMLSTMGPDATFFMFGVVCILLSLFFLLCVPETKQKTIAEIQKALGGFRGDGEMNCVSRI